MSVAEKVPLQFDVTLAIAVAEHSMASQSSPMGKHIPGVARRMLLTVVVQKLGVKMLNLTEEMSQPPHSGGCP